MNQGWVCPKCGKVNAPWKESCDCVQVVPANPYQYPVQPYYPQPWYPTEPTWTRERHTWDHHV